MKTLEEILAAAQGILDKAKAENRSMSGEEKAEYDIHVAQIKELQERAAKEKELVDLRAKMPPAVSDVQESKPSVTRSEGGSSTPEDEKRARLEAYGTFIKTGKMPDEMRTALGTGAGIGLDTLFAGHYITNIQENFLLERMRAAGRVFTVQRNQGRIAITSAITAAGLITQNGDIDDDTPTTAEWLTEYELGSEFKLSDTLVDGMGPGPLAQYLVDGSSRALDLAKFGQLLNGTGSSAPQGITSMTPTTTTATIATVTHAEALGIITALDLGTWNNPIGICSPSMLAKLAALKDADNKFLVTPAITGTGWRILGWPLLITGSLAADLFAFGDPSALVAAEFGAPMIESYRVSGKWTKAFPFKQGFDCKIAVAAGWKLLKLKA